MNTNSFYLDIVIAATLLSAAIAYVAEPLKKIAQVLNAWHADYRRVHHLTNTENR